jgi:ERCC4-type nuclease
LGGSRCAPKEEKKKVAAEKKMLSHIGMLEGITAAMRREIRKGKCTVSELATTSEKELMELEQEWLGWKPGCEN